MKKIIFLLFAVCVGFVASSQSSQTVFLNKKNLVYVIFDRNIIDIIYDLDVVQDERPAKRKDMIGLRHK